MYLCAKLQVSSITLTSFRQGWGVILPPPPPLTSKGTPKSPPRFGLIVVGNLQPVYREWPYRRQGM